jgi:hypothetical protein
MSTTRVVSASWLADLAKILDALAWPVVALVALCFVASEPGQRLLRPMLRRLRKVSAGSFVLELSEETARATKAEVEGGLEAYKKVLGDEMERLAHRYDVRPMMEAALKEWLPKPGPGAEYRATVHVRDPLIADTLYQLLDYYPGGDGARRRFSVRFGILGLTWRLRATEYVGNVDADDETKLIKEWGMTSEQAARAGLGRRSFMCLPLRSASGIQVGVLYLDATKANAFDMVARESMATSDEVKKLTAAVAALDEGVKQLGPSLQVVDS